MDTSFPVNPSTLYACSPADAGWAAVSCWPSCCKERTPRLTAEGMSLEVHAFLGDVVESAVCIDDDSTMLLVRPG